MKKLYWIGVLSILFYHCGQVETKKNEEINPNGSSKLALLMRAIFDEALQIKQQIATVEKLTFSIDHALIKTADATDPTQVNTDEYRSYANLYLHTVNELKKASPDNRIELYDHMIAACVACHSSICPGPLMKIDKLKF